jgi:hypothetical protein
MTDIKLNPKVDGYISREKRWQPEVIELRRIALWLLFLGKATPN